MSTLVVDNFDSFVFNLVHALAEIEGGRPTVVRNNELMIEEARKFDKIVLSPGPGIPEEAGIMPELVKTLAPTHRLLGVCLGHQCIGEVFGGTLYNMPEVVHGHARSTTLLVDDYLFEGIKSPFTTGRYHSWVVAEEAFPEELEIVANDEAGFIMALRHRHFDVRGVQFHPESVLTEEGQRMLRNWVHGPAKQEGIGGGDERNS